MNWIILGVALIWMGCLMIGGGFIWGKLSGRKERR